jgi:hypothetical protein
VSPPVKRSHKKKESAPVPDAELLAATACVALSAAAITLSGDPQTALLPSEQALIKPALVATLQSLSEQAQARVSQYTNPVLLIAGLGLWALRIAPAVKQGLTTRSQPVTPPDSARPTPAQAVTPEREQTGNASDRLSGAIGGEL